MITSNIIITNENITYFFSVINNKKYLIISNKIDENSFFILIDNLVNCTKIENNLYLSTNYSKLNNNKILALEYLIKKTINSLNKTVTKQLILKGRGFKSSIINKRTLQLKIGLSHLVKLEIPKNIKISLKKNKISCKSKQISVVNNFTTKIKKLKKKDVYKGKGILMQNDSIKLKPIKKK